MKIPLNWLNEYVDLPSDASELGRQLTSIGHMQDGPLKEAAGDTVLDLEIRQNRSDCYSILGVAREAAAVLEQPLRVPAAYSAAFPKLPKGGEVTIENPQLCYRFNALTLESIKVKASPKWLQQRLEAYGMKSINNVVDVTNFVMLEIGQPLHAFDAEKVTEQHLVIRSAHAGEKLIVLGNQEIKLVEDDLVIADPTGPLALAGVIGGEASGVTDTTKTIILEAATYNQASIRRSALRHDLRTEASTRLEKFLDPRLTELALQRAAELLQKLAGAKLSGHTDAYPNPQAEQSIPLRLSALQRLGGVEFSLQEVQKLLERLEIPSTFTQESEDMLRVSIPYFRTDLEQEADLVEEVMRLWGYDRIPERLPALAPPTDRQSPVHILEERVRDLMIAAGYDEQITEPLTNESKPEREPVLLQNSLTSEKIMLRTTLRETLFQAVVTRRKYRMNDIRIFEVGKIYYREGEEYQEPSTLGIILSGRNATYQEILGVVESVFLQLGRRYEPILVHIEQLADQIPTFFAQVNLLGILAAEEQETTTVRTTPPQRIFEDFSARVPTRAKVGEILEALRRLDPLVYSVQLGETPRTLGKDQKSLFLKVSYHDPERTLSTQDVVPIREKLTKFLWEMFDGEM